MSPTTKEPTATEVRPATSAQSVQSVQSAQSAPPPPPTANLSWQPLKVDKAARVAMNPKRHRPALLWFTGLSGAGKSTLANLVESALHNQGIRTYLLDGDNIRHGLSRDLGFSDADRVENIRRIAEVAALMVDAGLVVLAAFISPFGAERRLARGRVAEDEFIEIFVDAPLAVVEARDPKGLYARARAGEIRNFTGIDSAYEPPEHPELRIDTAATTPATAAALILDYLETRGIVGTAGTPRSPGT